MERSLISISVDLRIPHRFAMLAFDRDRLCRLLHRQYGRGKRSVRPAGDRGKQPDPEIGFFHHPARSRPSTIILSFFSAISFSPGIDHLVVGRIFLGKPANSASSMLCSFAIHGRPRQPEIIVNPWSLQDTVRARLSRSGKPAHGDPHQIPPILRAFLITWLIVIEQIMYQMIHAGMTQSRGAVRLTVP